MAKLYPKPFLLEDLLKLIDGYNSRERHDWWGEYVRRHIEEVTLVYNLHILMPGKFYKYSGGQLFDTNMNLIKQKERKPDWDMIHFYNRLVSRFYKQKKLINVDQC